jgi:hypothetical protein
MIDVLRTAIGLWRRLSHFSSKLCYLRTTKYVSHLTIKYSDSFFFLFFFFFGFFELGASSYIHHVYLGTPLHF